MLNRRRPECRTQRTPRTEHTQHHIPRLTQGWPEGAKEGNKAQTKANKAQTHFEHNNTAQTPDTPASKLACPTHPRQKHILFGQAEIYGTLLPRI